MSNPRYEHDNPFVIESNQQEASDGEAFLFIPEHELADQVKWPQYDINVNEQDQALFGRSLPTNPDARLRGALKLISTISSQPHPAEVTLDVPTFLEAVHIRKSVDSYMKSKVTVGDQELPKTTFLPFEVVQQDLLARMAPYNHPVYQVLARVARENSVRLTENKGRVARDELPTMSGIDFERLTRETLKAVFPNEIKAYYKAYLKHARSAPDN